METRTYTQWIDDLSRKSIPIRKKYHNLLHAGNLSHHGCKKKLNKRNFCLLESRMTGNYHVRFGGQNLYIFSSSVFTLLDVKQIF